MRNTSIRGGNFLGKDNLEEAKEQFRQLLELELKSGLVHFMFRFDCSKTESNPRS